MNCKPGDLAWVVGGSGDRRNVGRLVECVRFVGSVDGLDGNDLWLVNEPMFWWFGMEPYAPDCFLRPHRPGDLNETTDERKEVTA